MGFSTIGASVILFAALLFFSSTIANAWFEAQRDQDRMSEDQRDRYEMERATSFRIDDGDHTLITLTIDATNTGATSLDTSRLHLIVDGLWSTDDITSISVEGDPTYTTWSPGLEMQVLATVIGTPDRVWLVTETGYGALWVNPDGGIL